MNVLEWLHDFCQGLLSVSASSSYLLVLDPTYNVCMWNFCQAIFSIRWNEGEQIRNKYLKTFWNKNLLSQSVEVEPT